MMIRKDQINSIILVLFNCSLMSVGQVCGPLIFHVYYLHGGRRKWFNACLLTAGFPMLLIPIAFSHMLPRVRCPNQSQAHAPCVLINRQLVLASVGLGLLLSLDGYLYSFGLLYLPISISSLLGSTQLAFTAVFAFLVVRHRFTHYSVNAVMLMTFGSLILGFNMNGDRPRECLTATAALHGFIMPAPEYTHLLAGVAVSFDMVMKVQFLISMFATIFCTIPMVINKDFQVGRQRVDFGLSPGKYYAVVVLVGVAMQFLIMGSIRIIFCFTSLLGGLVTSLLVPMQQVFAVVFLRENFTAEKGMALAMCLWGFASYFYGEFRTGREKKEEELAPPHYKELDTGDEITSIETLN
ncbi:hypothetical protein CDL15_Pgr007028 [Punica granatum]|uniref:Probable purine permease n=1 Tax=Punica granatum TaxID=22663 RepID=A0A218X7R9_PUNGR|nr:hypothetical protein CDL15_Pgr007028 [Punica granatum]